MPVEKDLYRGRDVTLLANASDADGSVESVVFMQNGMQIGQPDSLPPYDVLDRILLLYVERGLSSSEIASEGFDRDLVRDIIRKVDLNEYKRKQAAPGLKITPLAFGVGRRIPIVQKYVS